MAGQSNMTSGALTADMPAELKPLPSNALFIRNGVAHDSIDWWTYFGPEASIIHAICDAEPHKNFLFLKHDLGGTSLYAAWHPTLDAARFAVTGENVNTWQYEDFISEINRFAPDVDISGFFWMQGERDAAYAVAGVDYANGLGGLVSGIESDTGRQVQKFVLGRTYANPSGGYAGYATVRAAQADVGTSQPGGALSDWVDTDDLSRYDPVHMDAAGIVPFGQRMYSAYLGL